MNYYALFYYTIPNFIERRAEYRAEHLRIARESHHRGDLLLAGALQEPADMALLVFRGADAQVARDFAEKDPYVLAGLVARWEVRPWAVVIADDAEAVPS